MERVDQIMGWVEVRPAGRPRACWREAGRLKRTACDSVEDCELLLQEVEQCSYAPPAERRPGRGVRGHRPSLTRYIKGGCRKDQCRKIHSDYLRDMRERLRQRLRDEPERFEHPSMNAFDLGCRCSPCVELGIRVTHRKNAARLRS